MWPSFCSSWWSTLVLPTWCWHYRYAKCKSYEFMMAFTKITEKGLGVRQQLQGNSLCQEPKRRKCLKQSEVKDAVETQWSWRCQDHDVSAGKSHRESGASPRERPCKMQPRKLVGVFGAHISHNLIYALVAGHRTIGFCILVFLWSNFYLLCPFGIVMFTLCHVMFELFNFFFIFTGPWDWEETLDLNVSALL